MSIQVSSRGCARGFILCVLWRGWKYVRQLKASGHYVCFPFPEEVIQEWIDKAIEDCMISPEFAKKFGGTDFDLKDSGTYWTHPSHFYTWWKNNVERKSKFQSLSKDAISKEDAAFDRLRGFYCQQAVALSANIRNHFDRILHQQQDDRLYQVALPVRMPDHMVLENGGLMYEEGKMRLANLPSLTIVFTSLDSFIVNRFPSMRKFITRREQRDCYQETAFAAMEGHGALADFSESVGTHLEPSCTITEEDMTSPRSKSCSSSLSLDADEEASQIALQHGMSLRPRPAKRARTYALSIPNAAADNGDDIGGRVRLLHSDSCADEDGLTEEDDNQLVEYEKDEEYCGETERGNRSYQSVASSSLSPRKRGRPAFSSVAASSNPLRCIVVPKVSEVLTRYGQEEPSRAATENSESHAIKEASVRPTGRITPQMKHDSPKPRRVKLPKSPPRPLVRSTSEPISVSTEMFQERVRTHSEPHGILARPLDLDDFQLFDEQEMLADSMLTKEVGQMAIVNDASVIQSKAMSDVVTLYPMLKTLQSSHNGEYAVLSNDHMMEVTDGTNESVVCRVCGTPRDRSQLGTPCDMSPNCLVYAARRMLSPDSISELFSSPSICTQKKDEMMNTGSFVPIQHHGDMKYQHCGM
jgi:hypothetical protein